MRTRRGAGGGALAAGRKGGAPAFVLCRKCQVPAAGNAIRFWKRSPQIRSCPPNGSVGECLRECNLIFFFKSSLIFSKEKTNPKD